MGYLGIYPGLIWLEYCAVKLREDELFTGTGPWHRCISWTSTSYTEWILSQDKYVAPDKYLFYSSHFLEPLQNNVRCCLGLSPSWCPKILVKTHHWTFPPCGNTSWIGVGIFLQNICLPIDKHNQLLYFLLRLSVKYRFHKGTKRIMIIW